MLKEILIAIFFLLVFVVAAGISAYNQIKSGWWDDEDDHFLFL